MIKIVIIGFGLSGAAAKLLFPEAKVIAKEAGEFAKYSGTIRVVRNESSDKFIKLLGIKSPIKPVNAAIEYKHNIFSKEDLVYDFVKVADEESDEDYDFVKNTEIFKKLFYKKFDKLNMQFDPKWRPSLSYEEYNLQSSKLYDIMFNKIQELPNKPIRGVITTISNDSVTCSNGEKFNYDLLISTIPAPLFWRCYGKEEKFESLPIYYCSTFKKPMMWSILPQYDFTYYTSEDYDRVNFNGNYYLYESMNEFTIDGKIIEQGKIDLGRFIFRDNISPASNIKFLGRFAEWSGDSSFDITLDKLYKLKEELK